MAIQEMGYNWKENSIEIKHVDEMDLSNCIYRVDKIKNMMIEITIPISNNDQNDYTNSSINHGVFLRKLGKSLTIDYLKKKMDEKDKMKF